MIRHSLFVTGLLYILVLAACQNKKSTNDDESSGSPDIHSPARDTTDTLNAISEPLVREVYTADPSAHVFDGKIYIYTSHDIESGIPEDDQGSHFDMKDYYAFSMDDVNGDVTNEGTILKLSDVPWAKKQLWAPDVAYKNDTYYLYFPAKDENDIFRIGVATASSPAGPFTPEAKPITGSYSIDPAVFKDDDGEYYMYFGGLLGGQLERWYSGEYDLNGKGVAPTEPAVGPKVAKLSDDLKGFAEKVKTIKILNSNGEPLLAGDNNRRFFEASWMHKYKGKYYFSYSTGDTHYIAYATGDSPYGPFTYQGVILNPVLGWTTHHSIVEYNGKWYLFYHDSSLSGGKTHLRSIKVTELHYNPDGTIVPITPYNK